MADTCEEVVQSVETLELELDHLGAFSLGGVEHLAALKQRIARLLRDERPSV